MSTNDALAAADELLARVNRMRDRWAEGDQAVKNDLWRDLHESARIYAAKRQGIDYWTHHNFDPGDTCSRCGMDRSDDSGTGGRNCRGTADRT